MKKAKRLFIVILIFILMLAISFLFISFIRMNLNPNLWTEDARAVFVIFGAPISFIFAGLIYESLKETN